MGRGWTPIHTDKPGAFLIRVHLRLDLLFAKMAQPKFRAALEIAGDDENYVLVAFASTDDSGAPQSLRRLRVSPRSC